MTDPELAQHNTGLIKALTCMMFFMFAMTTDAVGSIIPALIDEFDLSMSAAGAFHYVPMVATGFAGLLFLGLVWNKLKTPVALRLTRFDMIDTVPE